MKIKKRGIPCDRVPPLTFLSYFKDMHVDDDHRRSSIKNSKAKYFGFFVAREADTIICDHV